MSIPMKCPACGANNEFPAAPGAVARCVSCRAPLAKSAGPPPSPPAARQRVAAQAGSGSAGKILLIVGAVFLLLCGGVSTGVYYVAQRVRQAVKAEQDAVAKQFNIPGPDDVPKAGKPKVVDVADDIAALTRRETPPPGGAFGAMRLADDWHDLMKAAAGDQKVQAARRAAHWYREAYPLLSADEKKEAAARYSAARAAVEAADRPAKQFTLYAGKWRIALWGQDGARVARDYDIDADGRVTVAASTDGRAGRRAMLSRLDRLAKLTWEESQDVEFVRLADDQLEMMKPTQRDNALSGGQILGNAALLRAEIDGFKNPTVEELTFRPYKRAPANFTADFPGTPRVTSMSGKGAGESGAASLADGTGTVYAVRYEVRPGKGSEAELLAWAVGSLPGQAPKLGVTLGKHPGVDVVVEASAKGEPRTTRTRVLAAGDRVYHLSVTAPKDKPAAAAAVARFFDSFRLLDEPDATFSAPTEKADFAPYREAPPAWAKYASPDGKYSADFPGKMTEEATKSFAKGKDAGTGSVGRAYDASGAEYAVRWAVNANYPDEAALLTASADRGLARNTVGKKSLTLGSHPGVDFTASSATGGQSRAVRGRIFAVNDRWYQLTVTADAGASIPADRVARFFDSFRLTDEPTSKSSEPKAKN